MVKNKAMLTSQRLRGTRLGFRKRREGPEERSKCEVYPIRAMKRNWRKVRSVPGCVSGALFASFSGT